MDPDPRIHASDKIDPNSDPDTVIFVIDLQDANEKKIFFKMFSAYFFLKVHLHHLQR